MGRMSKVEPIRSRNFEIVIVTDPEKGTGWFSRNCETCANTDTSFDLYAFRTLKRVWRKNKDNFDSACRFMDYHDLFSKAGVKL